MHDLIYITFLVGLSPFLVLRALLVPKYRAGLAEKFGFIRRVKGLDRPTVWFHCVSVGETVAAVELIRAFRSRYPKVKIALSTTTPTGRAVAEKRQLGDVYFYYPFDLSWAVRRFLNVIRPKALVLMELEVWPNMLNIAARRGIPVAVVNGRMTEKSFRGFRRWRLLIRRAFTQLAFCGVQDESYQARFLGAGAPAERTVITGNLKYDALKEDLDATRLKQLQTVLQIEAEDLVLVGGSTHEGEEKILLDAFNALKNNFAALRLVLVPRHPERLDAVKTAVTASGNTFYLKTGLTGSETDVRSRVVIVDTMGELAMLYRLASVAFVGGSFSGTGGHNMLEPVIFRKPVIVGPSTFNFNEDMARLREGDGVLEAADPAAFTAALRSLLTDPGLGARTGGNGYAVVQKFRGGVARTLDLLDKHVCAGRLE